MKLKLHLTSTVLIFILALCISCHQNETRTIEDFKTSGTESNAADLFSTKCSMCHALKEDKIGPALAGVLPRWNNDTARLKGFIRNANAVIQSGDPYAKALYEKWNQSAMPPFTNLSDEELNQIIDYLK